MNVEMATAKATVRPNSKKNWPTIPSMNATGTKTAPMASEVAITANPISEIAIRAACMRDLPASMCR